jgi:hypothetical protein
MAKALQAKAAQALSSQGAQAVRSAVGPSSPRPLAIQSQQAAARPPLHTPPARQNASASLQVGDQVRHPELGVGQVEKIIPPLAKVAFPSGVKTFHLASAPLVKLG